MDRNNSEASSVSLTEPIVPSETAQLAPVSGFELASELESTIKNLLKKMDQSDKELNKQFDAIDQGLSNLKKKVDKQ